MGFDSSDIGGQSLSSPNARDYTMQVVVLYHAAVYGIVGSDWYWELNETLVFVFEFVYFGVSCKTSAQYETPRPTGVFRPR